MTIPNILYDCVVIGAGPGGLQGALHLARFSRNVLVLDGGGGRTRHAKHMANYLGYSGINGSDLIDIGLAQVKSFGVDVIREKVVTLNREEYFKTTTDNEQYQSRFVIGASGTRENIPAISNLGRFFTDSIITCIACDGYLTKGKKLVVYGNSAESVRFALAMKQMYTDDITLVLADSIPPQGSPEMLVHENIRLVSGRAKNVIGEDSLKGIELEDGSLIDCEAILLSFGATLNDSYLKNLNLERNEADGKFLINAHYESSLPGLYLTGSLCQGHSQAIIAAGQGAAAAFDINQKILAL